MLQVLLGAALVSTVLGIVQNGYETGWTEGATIFLAVFIIVTVTTLNNYIKERQFRKLQRKIDEQFVQVMRCGKVRQLDVSELVVGDIVNFNVGDIFPVDGIMVSGSEVKVDESSMTGETIQIRKVTYQEALTSNKNPFLISGTKVDDGTGTMMVLAVGRSSCQGKLKMLLEIDNPPTPLQQKLEGVAEDIGKLGTAVAILVFLAITLHILVKCWITQEMKFASLQTLSGILDGFMIGITIIVVAVPEGLPLAVTIALAFSVNKMKDEQNLVKNLASCEIMGGANEICSDKTGTLTQNQMTVVAFWMENQILKNEVIHTKQKQITKPTLDLFAEAICYNSTVYPFKSTITGKMMQIGNKTECALIELCDDYGYNFESYRPTDRIFRVVPFNSKRKKMFCIVFN